MIPSFNPSIHNYAVRCTSSPTTELAVTGHRAVTIGGEAFSSPVSQGLPLVAGQAVDVTTGANSYDIRCLPSDFPSYTATVTGRPRASGYLVDIGTYTIAFDTDGVPVWWFDEPGAVAAPPISPDPIDAKFLSPTTIAWHDSANQYQLRGLDGSLQGVVGGGAVPLNAHDFQLLPIGNGGDFSSSMRAPCGVSSTRLSAVAMNTSACAA